MTAQATSTRWVPTAGERARMSELVDDYLEQQVIIAQAKARQAWILAEGRAIAEAQTRRGGTGSEFEHPLRSMAAEFAVAGRMSDRTIRARMEWSVDLVDGFPATFAVFEEGRISEAHVRAIVDAGSRLEDDDSRAEFERIILPRAEKLTAGQLGSVARKLADDIEPLPFARSPRPRPAGVGRVRSSSTR